MIKFENSKILFLSAHMDDFEFGCGGIISMFSKDRKGELFFRILSDKRRSYDGRIQELRDKSEQSLSLEALGVIDANLRVYDKVPSQMYPEHRQLVLETLYEIGEEIKPDVIFVPSFNDIHQDHRTLAEASLKAFKRASICGYEILNSTFNFNPSFYIELGEIEVQKKIKAISCYKSQYAGGNTTGNYFSPTAIGAHATYRGVRISVPYAEAFEIYQMVVR